MGFIVQTICLEVDEGKFYRPMEIMNLDVRNKSEVYIVCRRETPDRYHFQGIAVAVDNLSAEQVAVSMCRDETYFIFPCLVNTVLTHNETKVVGLYFPLKKNADSDTNSSGVE